MNLYKYISLALNKLFSLVYSVSESLAYSTFLVLKR